MAFIAYTYILLTTYCHHQYKYFCNLILLIASFGTICTINRDNFVK